jgi:hypothetical protein
MKKYTKKRTKEKKTRRNKGEVTPPRNPLDEVETSKKRKVSPTKPTS